MYLDDFGRRSCTCLYMMTRRYTGYTDQKHLHIWAYIYKIHMSDPGLFLCEKRAWVI